MRLASATSSMTPLTMRECARETSWLSGKGSFVYWCSERRSSSSRRVRGGRTVAHPSSASHIASRLDFQGGTGLVTPYFSAIRPHTCPRSTSCSSYSKAAGFETIAVTHSKDKEELAYKLGADSIVADGKGLLEDKGRGADVILATSNSYKATVDDD